MGEGAGPLDDEGGDIPLGGWDQVFARSPLAMAVMVGDRYRRVNPALCELMGRPAEDILDRSFTELISEDLVAQIQDTRASVAGGERRVHLEGPFHRADGTTRYVAIDAVIVNNNGDTASVAQVSDLTDLYEARTRLGASERRFRSLLTNISDTVSLMSADGKLLYTTGDQTKLLGYPAEHWTEAYLPIDLIHPDDLDRVIGAWERSLAEPGVEVEVEARLLGAKGDWIDVATTGVNLVDDPDVGGVVVTTRDITALRRAERLASSQALVLELIARGSPLTDVIDACVDLVETNGSGGSCAVHLLDEEGRLTHRGGAIAGCLGELGATCLRTAAPVLVDDVDGADTDPALAEALRPNGMAAGWAEPILAIGSGTPVGTVAVLYSLPHRRSEHERNVGELVGRLVAIAIDHADNEQRLAHLALHDPLTGLPNRSLLLDRLDHALARRARSKESIAVLFCDLDRFKVVNDSLGHGVGDQLLSAFADRLRQTVRPGDTVARFGGDEFVVLLEDITQGHQPVQVAERIASSLLAPFVLDGGREVYLTASIGLAVASDHTTGDAWLRDADAAMYQAKDRGRNRLELFDTEMREAAIQRLQVETDLRRAVERDELVLHFQPVVDLRSGRVCGAEALVRWNHPVRGLVPPVEFIGVAEDTGMIESIGRHILDLALQAAGPLALRCRGHRFQLGVNVSAAQLGCQDLDTVIDELCNRHGWPHRQLVLEITETALARGIEDPGDLLTRIHDLGVQLAIDDFGTGYSSLTRLGQMRVDEVKIDRAFVGAIDQPGDRLVRIVDAVVAVAGALDLGTSAEGVETQAQLDYLRRIDCDLAQGYLFAKPLPLDEFESLLDADPRW